MWAFLVSVSDISLSISVAAAQRSISVFGEARDAWGGGAGGRAPPGGFLPPGLRELSWTFAGHELTSYRTYRDVKHTVRKLLMRSPILDGQTCDLSFPR